MVDKIVSVPRSAIGDRIGHCGIEELQLVEDALRRWLEL
jgi:mRNA-degrading endonuclease toxin of MazEF toxin-antitoxin module